MRTLIALNGTIADDKICLAIARTCDYRVCADGGARHLVRLGVTPDLLIGDLDSITTADLAWMKARGVPIERYPANKDWTDSELAIENALSHAKNRDHELWMIGALGARLDHVLANLGIGARLASMGVRAWLTDGRVFVTYLAGRTSIQIDLDWLGLATPVVSLIPAAGKDLAGVTLTGLAYPLDHAFIPAGSTRGVSNSVLPGKHAIEIRIESGLGYVVLSPAGED